ncbi:MAG: hypothetical protein H8E12_14360 [Rhodobacteraceae bacterium]|nr:hypothetical protein [Paracoccaceae bacterium]
MKLDDSAIAQIAKSLQVAILTGTDVVDNLRQLEFICEDDTLLVNPDYAVRFEENIEKMLSEVNQIT